MYRDTVDKDSIISHTALVQSFLNIISLGDALFLGKTSGEQAEAAVAVTAYSVHRASAADIRLSVTVSAEYIIVRLRGMLHLILLYVQ